MQQLPVMDAPARPGDFQQKMVIVYPEAGLERLRELLPLHVDDYGDLAIEALSEADGYYTVAEIDDLLAAGLLNWPELKPTDHRHIRPAAPCRTAEPKNVPVGGAISRSMINTRYSKAAFERLCKVVYRFVDEFRDRHLTEADIFSFLGEIRGRNL